MTQPYQASTGQSAMQATVLSVQGARALVQNQLGQQIEIRRDLMRAKGVDMPQPGEVWMITKEFGNFWSFALLMSASKTPVPRPQMLTVASQAVRDALTDLDAGQEVYRLDAGLKDIWNGTAWHGLNSLTVTSDPIPNMASAQATSPYTIITIQIFDPGWPYRIQFSGSVNLSASSTQGFDLVPRQGSNTGPNLIPPWSLPATTSRDSNALSTFPITGTTSGIYTGNMTVHVTIAKFSPDTGTGYRVNGQTGSRVSATLLPVP